MIRSWALTRGFSLHPGTRNRYEIRYTGTQHRPPSRQVDDHGRVSGTHRAIEDIRAAHEPTNKPRERSLYVPSATQRIREMLCEDMGMPQGLDAYHRMSGVAHSEPIAIIATWNFNEDKPSIDYYSFLEFLHLGDC